MIETTVIGDSSNENFELNIKCSNYYEFTHILTLVNTVIALQHDSKREYKEALIHLIKR